MKKIIFLIALSAFMAVSAEELKPKGTYSNLLFNGKLELFAGSFPQFWRYVGANRPDYATDGGFNNGGRFIFMKKNVYTTVRQDWTFSIFPGEKYRFRAKIRGKKFRASTAVFMVLNNGFKKSVKADIPRGDYDWQDFSFDFTGFESRGGYYTALIRVNKQSSGTLEISDVIVEPATESAFQKSTAYLKLIPPVKVVPVSPRRSEIPASDPKLLCRWFGDKKAESLEYSIGNVKRKAEIKNDFVTLDFSGLKAGKHTVTLEDKTAFAIKIVPVTMPLQAERLNNLHNILLKKTVQAASTAAFVNPRNGWVLFTMPETMQISIDGKKLQNGQFIRLPMGEYEFKTIAGSGNVTVSAVSEVSMYSFATGPFFTNSAKKDWAFTEKYMLPYVMNYLGSEASQSDIAKLRNASRRYYTSCNISRINNAKLNSNAPITPPGMDKKNSNVDGIYIDELSINSEKPLVYFLKNLPRLTVTADRDVYTYVCGTLQKNAFTAKVFSDAANLSDYSFILDEIYIPNGYADEKAAWQQIKNQLTKSGARVNELMPGFMPCFGVALCQSNMHLNFSIDNEPEADHRVLLDMQMYELANDPVFKDLGNINFWGGNYADTDRQKFLARLLKHYVFEGKTTLLSKELGLKLVPGHLKNASFREHLKYWKKIGSVGYGKDREGGAFLKQFKNNLDASNMAIFTKNKYSAKLNQMMHNLEPGKKYKIRFVISGNGLLNVRVDNKPIEAVCKRLDTKRLTKVKNADTTALCDAVFTAGKSSELLEFFPGEGPDKAKINLHFVSVLKELD